MAQSSTISPSILLERYSAVRRQSERICSPLETEDYVAQPVVDVSPPRWHLAHTTWFFETFILVPYLRDYTLFHPRYPYLFNSYYVQAGERWQRANRGSLTRPTVAEIMDYRRYVDTHMTRFLENTTWSDELDHVFQVGLNHEQQHQELLVYDIKHILGLNPLFPVYSGHLPAEDFDQTSNWLRVSAGNYDIGHQGTSFCFDNELGVHNVYLHDFEIMDQLISKGEYLEFINEGGYKNATLWLDEGWSWVSSEGIDKPMYWVRDDNGWMEYTLNGLQPIRPNDPVSHISFYEADAFARWKGYRLPTEFEWETACKLHARPIDAHSNFLESDYFRAVQQPARSFLGNLWEWTSSSYRPYPFFKTDEGALGEYNGKFMINQMVLRGGSFATPRDHIRVTYRNFFHPHLRWLFAGIRLARHI